MKRKFKTIDLFAGIGGMRLAFEKTERFKTVFANDFDKFCKYTYDENFEKPKLNTEDIRKIAQKNDLPNFDVLLAGFPCQPFSIAGYREGFEDKERGNLFFEMYKIIKKHPPKVLFLENVKNLKGHNGGKTIKVIRESLEHLGYTVYADVLSSMEYANIPQNRERIFIIGFHNKVKNRLKFHFPQKIALTKSFREVLEKKVDKKYYYSERYSNYKKLKKEVVSKDTVYQWRRIYVRKNKKGVCPTFTANMGTGGHNVPIILDKKGIRKLTPRECFNLQGFPKEFIFSSKVSDTQLYKQAGNSVTVPLIERLALGILEVLDKSFRKKIKILPIPTRLINHRGKIAVQEV